MSYCVYILKSLKNNDVYVGSTENLEKRLILHSNGRVRSTKSYRPWVLVETKSCSTRREAVQLERFLKTGQQKEFLKRRHGLVAKG